MMPRWRREAGELTTSGVKSGFCVVGIASHGIEIGAHGGELALRYLLSLAAGEPGFKVDDIDHFGNRRIRTMGGLVANQFRTGMSRMEGVMCGWEFTGFEVKLAARGGGACSL
ncbi:MAG: hypothetical protein Q4B77_03075 [Coriobacteriaceae bacterium]|nr:hypothetical protein [Coriobacteriaceae bacterium]